MIATIPHAPCKGIDTIQALTAAVCRDLVVEGYQWVARYLPRDERRLDEPDASGGDYRGCWTLSRGELETILSHGLAVVPVQWGPPWGSSISAEEGADVGGHAAACAAWLGVPAGVHLWCDLEGGMASRAGTDGCVSYVEAWAQAVRMAGYRAGLYVGDPDVLLDAKQLHGLIGIDSYWRSATHVLALRSTWDPRFRGWSILQSPPTMVCGVTCDPDVLRPDDRGALPVWVAK